MASWFAVPRRQCFISEDIATPCMHCVLRIGSCKFLLDAKFERGLPLGFPHVRARVWLAGFSSSPMFWEIRWRSLQWVLVYVGVDLSPSVRDPPSKEGRVEETERNDFNGNPPFPVSVPYGSGRGLDDCFPCAKYRGLPLLECICPGATSQAAASQDVVDEDR